MGECYIDLTCASLDGIYDAIGSCSFCMDGQELETLTGKTLETLAQVFDKNALEHESVSVGRRRHVMIHLPFFFTHATRDFIPRTRFNAHACVDLVLDAEDALDIRDVSLIFKTVYLDTDERKELLRKVADFKFAMLSCVSETTQAIPVTQGVLTHTVALPDLSMVRKAGAVARFFS